MTIFTNRAFTLSALGLLVGVSVTSLSGCPGEELCGPCGTLANGSLSISGDAKLDGFFKAVADLGDAHATINGEFEGHILALAEIYGVAATEFNAELVGQVQAAIQADFDASLDAGIQLKYQPPKCSANVSVAVEAQAQCEASADCEVMADPGMVSVVCEGGCQGGCSGSCSGELSCAVKTPTVACEGQCEGSCELSAAASCEGTCRGQCSGNCSAQVENAMGMMECAGACDADCQGTCEISGRASCGGTCHGTCYVEQGSAQCQGEVECSGSCDAECSGKCEGSATPPSASADCEASAECNAQASAQASANVECTPPSLDFEFSFDGNLDAEGQAAFVARLKELKVRGIAIIQGFARYGALITGEVNGEVVFNPSPLVRIQGEFEAVANAAVDGELDIAAGKITCIPAAIAEVGHIFDDLVTEGGANLQAQAGFVVFLTTQAG